MEQEDDEMMGETDKKIKKHKKHLHKPSTINQVLLQLFDYFLFFSRTPSNGHIAL